VVVGTKYFKKPHNFITLSLLPGMIMPERKTGMEATVRVNESWKKAINFNRLGAEKKQYVEAAVARLGNEATEDDRTRAAQEAAGSYQKAQPPQKVCKTLKENVWRASHGQSGEGICLICKRVVTVWEFDVCHKVSKKNGGVLELDNLFVGCHECNIRQGSMNLDEYLAIRRAIVPPQPSSGTEAPPSCSATFCDVVQVMPVQSKYDRALEKLMAIETEIKQEQRQPLMSRDHYDAREHKSKEARFARPILIDLAMKRRVDVEWGERWRVNKLLGYEAI
jgi:hypothetical protein